MPPRNGGAPAPGKNVNPPAKAAPKAAPKPAAKPVSKPAPASTPTSAVPSKLVAPFLTPEQANALDQYLGQLRAQLDSLDTNYREKAALAVRDAGNIVGGNYKTITAADGSAYQQYLGGGTLDNSGTLWAQGAGAQQTADNALAARGLEQSSVRDMNLGDIATSTLLARTNMLSDLSQLGINNDAARQRINDAKTTTQGHYNELAVANAQAVTPTPDPPPATAPLAPKPAAPKPAPLPAIGKVVGPAKAVLSNHQTVVSIAKPKAPKQQKTVKVGTSFNGGARG